MSTTKQAYSDEALAIHARDVSFDWTDVPTEYIPGHPYATHFWNVMHLVLPEGERAMADVLGRALPQIDDPRLAEELVGFIGQEETHASSHESFRIHLQENGFDIPKIMRLMEFLMDQVFGDHGLKGRAGEAWFHERLGIYAAAEHFTATVGEWLLDNRTFDEIGVDPTMLDLLRWHGAEEMEHRNVAYDVFQYVDGSYARRVRTALLASGGLLALWLYTSSWMYANDPNVKGSKWAWPIAFVKDTRRGLMPGLKFIFKEIPQYLRPGFHPSQMGPIDKAVRYLAQSPAASGL
ncbi:MULTISPECIES: metal-dependent hydrolase [unclassified Nocardioides]|uniref:metal-dependent hydrolase n=1 Tax=unclassified Nocardioides TaxID=2615069 RepID=UPI0006F3E084|nr:MULTISPECIES: metal-dependent hydrolase [unclassified Nocardioides]KQY57722.1 metal-dependent hydrolase [Nocardioides sp. Root140]KQZ68958.1 metal-dependent hydrolase [Nocardioides sp. Root151]KRF11971.1 metal-dependent hydrolase [Nocardioides sp. Soil796]